MMPNVQSSTMHVEAVQYNE